MELLRLALIGPGRRGGGAHLPVIARMTDRFELVAVGDVDPEAARVGEEYGARGYTSLRDLVARDRPYAAVVTAPPDAHHAVPCFLPGHVYTPPIMPPPPPTPPPA